MQAMSNQDGHTSDNRRRLDTSSMAKIKPDLSEAFTVKSATKEDLQAHGYRIIKLKGAVTTQ